MARNFAGKSSARAYTQGKMSDARYSKALGLASRAGMRKKINKVFKNKVLAVVKKEEENKYVAASLGVVGVLGTLTVPTGLIPAIPKIAQGVQSNQRIGQKIDYCRGRVDFQFFLISDGSGAYPSQDVWIKVFKLNSKQAKSYGQVALLPGNTLLDVGNQTSTDWNAGTPTTAIEYSQMPLSSEDFTGSIHTIRLTKNQGVPNGDLSAGQSPNTFGHPAACYSYSWKHSKLLYDDTSSNNPTNFAPIFGVVAMNTDNTPFNGQLQYVARQHIWFKDS